MDYDWITSAIALGAAFDDRFDADELVAQGVTHVVNMCVGQTDDAYFARHQGVHLASFGLADGENEGDLGYQRLQGAVSYITNVLAGDLDAKVYLHCAAGISRSPAVMCGVLMRTERVSLTDALERVRRARPIVNPHPAHLVALLRLAQDDQNATPAWTNGPQV